MPSRLTVPAIWHLTMCTWGGGRSLWCRLGRGPTAEAPHSCMHSFNRAAAAQRVPRAARGPPFPTVLGLMCCLLNSRVKADLICTERTPVGGGMGGRQAGGGRATRGEQRRRKGNPPAAAAGHQPGQDRAVPPPPRSPPPRPPRPPQSPESSPPPQSPSSGLLPTSSMS